MNTLDAPATDEQPRTAGLSTVLRIKLFVAGALFGAGSLLFVVLMQWHAPDRLGWTVSWLPSKHTAERPRAAMPAPVVSAATAALEIPATLAPRIQPAPAVLPAMPAPVLEAATQPGELLIPVAGIAAGQLDDTFKDARGSGRVHDAMDIMAPNGTPVFAVADGRLVKLFNSKQGGLTIYQFDSGETRAYYYAHLARYADGMTEGRALRRGETIGYVGSTGNASPDGPHLHFAVFVLGPEKKWWQGTAINPYPLLTGTP
jgi:murein DD-endopeptidase MepM/ murein hydrolase activator NlpD